MDKKIRPTIRLDKKFNDDLKIAFIKNNTTFQEVCEELLKQWYNKHK